MGRECHYYEIEVITVEGHKKDDRLGWFETRERKDHAFKFAEKMVKRFHPEDRLMLWFDFFNHDSERVRRNMRNFMEKVAPMVAEKLAD